MRTLTLCLTDGGSPPEITEKVFNFNITDKEWIDGQLADIDHEKDKSLAFELTDDEFINLSVLSLCEDFMFKCANRRIKLIRQFDLRYFEGNDGQAYLIT